MEEKVCIPELWGEYNQTKLGVALEEVGLNNPMPLIFQTKDITWKIGGEIDSQGIALAYEQQIFDPISIGFSWFFMRATSRQRFTLKDKGGINQPGHFLELEESRRKMHEELGLCEANSRRTGIGDFNCYVRFGGIWDCAYKCRQIDAGVRLGLLMPSGLSRDIYSPTTVPFGGNGHWGAYIMTELESELKEDMFFGFWACLSKRFSRTKKARFPIAGEHPLYGALVTSAIVQPGINFFMFPYFSIENLRAGLGARLGYALTVHERDCYYPCNSGDYNIETGKLADISSWASDYGFVSVFYDFGKLDVECNHKPIVTFTWEIPFLLWASKNVVKTHRVTLGIEVHF